MNSGLLTLTLLFDMMVFSNVANAQHPEALPVSYNVGGGESRLTGNVPLNEINIHAFRHFRKRWPAVFGETWLKTEEGYIVSFEEHTLRCQARFDGQGAFMYSLKYYAGDHVSNDLCSLINDKYPGYLIDVVTEITNGDKVFYLVKIENSSSVKTLSVADGKVEVFEELITGGIRMEPGN